MTNHEGLYAFSRPKSFYAILRAPFNRAIISALLFFSAAVAPSLLSQSLSKEYLRLGGRVVAVESFSFSVTPDPPTSVLGADNQQTFTASRTANWSVTSGSTIAPGAGLSTTLTVANPIPNGLLSLTVTATEQGGSGSKSIIVAPMTAMLPATSLALHPSQGFGVTQPFRTSAMSTYPGGDIPLTSMSAKDPCNKN